MPNLTAILSEVNQIGVVVNTRLFRRARISQEAQGCPVRKTSIIAEVDSGCTVHYALIMSLYQTVPLTLESWFNVSYSQNLRYLHWLHSVRPGLPNWRSRDGSLGWLQSWSNCLIAAYRRLCRLQAVRNCLSYRLFKHPGLPRCWNYTQYGSSILIKKFGEISLANVGFKPTLEKISSN